MQLTQFKKNPDNNTYHLKFSDGYEADVSVQQLRNNCPCANCKGEEVLLHKYEPMQLPVITPVSYELEDVKPVGNYAIRLYWKDGHNTGMYTWDKLRKISEENKSA